MQDGPGVVPQPADDETDTVSQIAYILGASATLGAALLTGGLAFTVQSTPLGIACAVLLLTAWALARYVLGYSMFLFSARWPEDDHRILDPSLRSLFLSASLPHGELVIWIRRVALGVAALSAVLGTIANGGTVRGP